MAAEHHFALSERQPRPGRNAYLLLDDIEARHHLGDAMLHLETGIRLHEVEVPRAVHQELEGTGIRVLNGLGSVHRLRPHLAPLFLGERRAMATLR